jgi:hypothetical protein
MVVFGGVVVLEEHIKVVNYKAAFRAVRQRIYRRLRHLKHIIPTLQRRIHHSLPRFEINLHDPQLHLRHKEQNLHECVDLDSRRILPDGVVEVHVELPSLPEKDEFGVEVGVQFDLGEAAGFREEVVPNVAMGEQGQQEQNEGEGFH